MVTSPKHLPGDKSSESSYLESFKFKVLKECDFRHLETELVCYNASLYHVRMLLFSIEEKNSLATLK